MITKENISCYLQVTWLNTEEDLRNMLYTNNYNTRLKWYYESRDKVLLRFKREVEVLALRAQWWWNDARRRPGHGYGVSFLKMLINAVGHYFDGNIYIDIHKGYLPVVFCSGSITILHWYQCGYHRVAILDFWNELKMSFPLQSFGKNLRSTGAGSLCMICRIKCICNHYFSEFKYSYIRILHSSF